MLAKGRTSSKKAKVGPKSTTIAAYTGVFLLTMSMVAIGYQPPQEVNYVASVATPNATASATAVTELSVDQIVATNVGASIATRANLPVAPSITNQSVSLSIQSQLAQQTDSTSIAKPQIVQPTSDSRTIQKYVTKEGDTVTSVAAQFGVSTDTVKWANNLAGDSIAVDKELDILPVDGVLYTVKAGDTLESIAEKYKTSTQMVMVYNDLELTGVVKDQRLIVPSGVMPTEDRPGYVAPRPVVPVFYTSYAGGYNGGGSIQIVNYADYVPAGVTLYTQTNAGYNGQCTWFAYMRRAAIGRPIPNAAHGNAVSWAASFSARGYAVNKTPAVGAIFQNGGGYGHVGVVESLNADGSITVSEMNASAGTYGVNLRTIPASAIGNFNYIH